MKSVLVTGAGTGIGFATTLHLARRGLRVYAALPDLSHGEELERAARQHKVRLRILQLDVTDRQSIQAAVARIVDESGSLYGLVNNAGIGLRGFFEDLADSEIRRMFDVNFFGVLAVTKEVLPHMRTNGEGRIIIISSAGGRIATMTLSAYCAGKFAVEGFGESLALEVAPLGLSVSLIEPGLVLTPHFTVNRGRSQAARSPQSSYYDWFVQHEKMVDDILRQHRISGLDVAKVVHRALTAQQPKLRYVVGWRAKLLISLRRHLPGEIFESLYFHKVIRMVTRPRDPVRDLDALPPLELEPSDSVFDAVQAEE